MSIERKKVKLVKEPSVTLVAMPVVDWSSLAEALGESTTTLLAREGDKSFLDFNSDAELLSEACGKGCYDAWGSKGKAQTNEEYLNKTVLKTKNPHMSIAYHPRFTFLIDGISRRVSHELVRHNVGTTHSQDGAISQISTRFTHHPGEYVPPLDGCPDSMFYEAAQKNYDGYNSYIDYRVAVYKKENGGRAPYGLDKKRIYESASHYLMHSCTTRLFWSAGPIALEKMFRERIAIEADAEFRRLAIKWRAVCKEAFPNFFPGEIDE